MSDPINQVIQDHENDSHTQTVIALLMMAQDTDNMAEFTRIMFRVDNLEEDE